MSANVATSSRHTTVKKPLSCAECRRLKIKCDLKFPCRQCIKRNLDHLCPSGELVNGSRKTKQYISNSDLQHRISDLEFALQEQNPGHPLLGNALFIRPSSEVHDQRRTPVASSSSSTLDTGGVIQSYGRLIVGETTGVSRYYGSASSVYLSKTTLPRPADLPRTALPVSDLDFPNLFSTGDSSDAMDVNQIMSTYLPDEITARYFSDIYFNTIAWWTNVVPYFSWEDRVHNHIYRSDRLESPPNAQQLALLFLVLALGVLMDLSRQARDPLAKVYFSAAHKCLAADPSHSMTYVQCIYLVGAYLMNGGSDNVGGDNFWPLLRTGCAIAEAVGLHRDGSHWNLDDISIKERRCVFWSIHAFDVVQSIALGRGQCISTDRIDCELPSTEEGDETGFFYYKNLFMGVISRVNELLVRIRPATYTEVLKLDTALSDFEGSLPSELSHYQPPTNEEISERPSKLLAYHRTFMLLYINETRLALHRPFFVKALNENPSEPTDSPYKQSFLGCLEAARTLITLVSNMSIIHGKLIERRWHFLFHLFSACACLAACGIRANTSMLARSMISELDRGLAIFKAGNRKEADIIMRLRDHAMTAIKAGRAVDGADMEDLDLLGARTTLQNSLRAPVLSDEVDPSIQSQAPLYDISSLLGLDTNYANPTMMGEYTDFDWTAFLAST